MAFSASTLRSDSLAALRPLVGPGGLLKMFEGIFQTTLILDANIVLGEIRWLTLKRKNKDARSELRELMEARTILAIAPSFLKEEMELNLRKMAIHKGRLRPHSCHLGQSARPRRLALFVQTTNSLTQAEECRA